MSGNPEREFVDWATADVAALARRAFLVCQDEGLAEDLLQETLTRVYVRWLRFGAPHSPRAYARATLAHVAVDWSRKRSTREVLVADPPEHAVQGSAGPGDDRDVLRLAMASLTTDQRAVLALRFLDDLSVESSARELGRTPTWVKQTTRRALRRIRQSYPELSHWVDPESDQLGLSTPVSTRRVGADVPD